MLVLKMKNPVLKSLSQSPKHQPQEVYMKVWSAEHETETSSYKGQHVLHIWDSSGLETKR